MSGIRALTVAMLNPRVQQQARDKLAAQLKARAVTPMADAERVEAEREALAAQVEAGHRERVAAAGQRAEKRKIAGNKYQAKRMSADGHRFDSMKEYRNYQELKLREKAGEIEGLRLQVKFSLFSKDGEHIGVYRADFVYAEVVGDDRKKVVVDVKGRHTQKLAAWSRTKKLFRACHGYEITEVL